MGLEIAMDVATPEEMRTGPEAAARTTLGAGSEAKVSPIPPGTAVPESRVAIGPDGAASGSVGMKMLGGIRRGGASGSGSTWEFSGAELMGWCATGRGPGGGGGTAIRNANAWLGRASG